MPVEVYLENQLEPLILDEPLQATATNMSAAMNHNMIYFQGKTSDGETVMIAIPHVVYLKEVEAA